MRGRGRIGALNADASIGMVALARRMLARAAERQYLCKRYPSVWVLSLRRASRPPHCVRAFSDGARSL
jgi:hypothetical protein